MSGWISPFRRSPLRGGRLLPLRSPIPADVPRPEALRTGGTASCVWPNLRLMTYGFQSLGRTGADRLEAPRTFVESALYDLSIDQARLLIRFKSN